MIGIAKKILELLDIVEEKVKMVCMECGHKFTKNLSKNTYEVRCPKCHGYDTEPE